MAAILKGPFSQGIQVGFLHSRCFQTGGNIQCGIEFPDFFDHQMAGFLTGQQNSLWVKQSGNPCELFHLGASIELHHIRQHHCIREIEESGCAIE